MMCCVQLGTATYRTYLSVLLNEILEPCEPQKAPVNKNLA
jgi:hypothetical protein